MPLPFKLKSLDDVDEAYRPLYRKGDDGFTLDVDGIESKDTSALESTLERLKREKRELKAKLEAKSSLTADEAEELEQLRTEKASAEEAKAREAGKFDELLAKHREKHDREKAALQTQIAAAKDAVKKLTVTNELRSAIAKAGVKAEYHDAVEALLSRRGPDVQWEDGKDPIGIFPDEVEGNKPIPQFVAEWAKSEAASPYMPPENGGGGGGTGDRGKGGKSPSHSGKKFSEMSVDEQITFTNEKYGAGATA